MRPPSPADMAAARLGAHATPTNCRQMQVLLARDDIGPLLSMPTGRYTGHMNLSNYFLCISRLAFHPSAQKMIRDDTMPKVSGVRGRNEAGAE